MGRFDPDGTSGVVVSSVGENPVNLPVGTRLELRDYLAPAVVWRTGRPAQVNEDAWSSVSDPVADAMREAGVRSLAASPILVEGRLWAAVTAWTGQGPFPAGTADRMADFTELLATAVGNAAQRTLARRAAIAIEVPALGRCQSRSRWRRTMPSPRRSPTRPGTGAPR
jgi:hypothetical protein